MVMVGRVTPSVTALCGGKEGVAAVGVVVPDLNVAPLSSDGPWPSS